MIESADLQTPILRLVEARVGEFLADWMGRLPRLARRLVPRDLLDGVKRTVVREVEAGSLAMVPLETEELVRPLGIIHRRGKELGSTTRRFIELLQHEAQHDPLNAQSGIATAGISTADGAYDADYETNGHSRAAEEGGEEQSSRQKNGRPQRAVSVKVK